MSYRSKQHGKSKGKKNEKLPQSPEGVSFHPALQSLPTSSISITEESDVESIAGEEIFGEAQSTGHTISMFGGPQLSRSIVTASSATSSGHEAISTLPSSPLNSQRPNASVGLELHRATLPPRFESVLDEAQHSPSVRRGRTETRPQAGESLPTPVVLLTVNSAVITPPKTFGEYDLMPPPKSASTTRANIQTRILVQDPNPQGTTKSDMLRSTPKRTASVQRVPQPSPAGKLARACCPH